MSKHYLYLKLRLVSFIALDYQIFAFLRQLEESHSSSFAQSVESEDFARAVAHIEHTILSLKGLYSQIYFLAIKLRQFVSIRSIFQS